MPLRALALSVAVGAVAYAAHAVHSATPQSGAEPIRALLITGHNNHNWQYTSRVHKDTLEATGRFQVDVTEEPAMTLADAAGLKKYQLFVLDYNDMQQPKRWGEAGGPAETNFIQAVKNGAGVVAIHSADNAFRGWKEYEQMLGLMWRDGTGHGRFHDFDVQIVDKEHPITKGLAEFKSHPDELYHKLVNAQQTSPHILMRAQDEKDNGGTGGIEPMAFTLEFGKGHIFATPLGHVWNGDFKTKHSVIDPQFRVLLCRGAEWAATGAVTLPATWSDSRPHNVLSPEESKDGWKLLFDGSQATANENFREYKGQAFPTEGWSVHDGAIVHAKGGKGGDIVTKGEYTDFEFQCQWKITSGGNSGIMYHVTEDHGAPYETGPEMQILDDEMHADKAKPQTRAGAMYDLFGVAADTCRPAGEWNSVRIVVRGTHNQFYLNGVKVIDADSTSDEYKQIKAKSKWANVPDFNAKPTGHVDLQNHGDEVWFRDLKVRELK